MTVYDKIKSMSKKGLIGNDKVVMMSKRELAVALLISEAGRLGITDSVEIMKYVDTRISKMMGTLNQEV